MSHDKGTIPQPGAPSPGGPQSGEPYNYSKVLDTVLIPQVVYADRRLSPGARILWGIVRRLGHKSGRCFATEGTLAAELAVTDRQVKRYCRQLVAAGLMRETRQPGRPTVRELLWHDRFNSEDMANTTAGKSKANTGRTKAPSKTPVPRTETSWGSGHFCPGGQDISVPRILKRGVLEASLEAAPPSPSEAPSPRSEIEGENRPKPEEEEEAAAAALGLSPTAAAKQPLTRELVGEHKANVLRSADFNTAADRSPAQLAKFIRFQYLTLMNQEPPIDALNSIVRILSTRKADHILYACTMTAVLKVLREPATVGIWLRKAVEVGTEITAAEIAAAD